MKIAIFATLLLFSTGAGAAWEYLLSVKEQPEHKLYGDAETVVRNGNVVGIWMLLDYGNAKGRYLFRDVRSMKFHKEYDCAAHKSRLTLELFYAGHMGNGDSVGRRENASGWLPVAPGSIDRFMWDIMCRGKVPTQ